MKSFFQSNTVAKVLFILGALLVILIVFQAGLFVGYRQGAFSSNWDNSLGRDIRDPHSFFAPFIRDGEDAIPHGSAGEIISVKLPLIMLKSVNGTEQIVVLSPTTTIRSLRDAASTSELSIGKNVIVIGEPGNDGEIEASFVRIIPPPPNGQAPPGIGPKATSSNATVNGR